MASRIARGDIRLYQFAPPDKKRPAVVIQANAYNATLRHVVVAEVTSNPRWTSDPACVYIDVTTPEGQATGLHKNGVVSCLHLVTMNRKRISMSSQFAYCFL